MSLEGRNGIYFGRSRYGVRVGERESFFMCFDYLDKDTGALIRVYAHGSRENGKATENELVVEGETYPLRFFLSKVLTFDRERGVFVGRVSALKELFPEMGPYWKQLLANPETVDDPDQLLEEVIKEGREL